MCKRLLVLLLIAGLVAASCGGDDSDGSGEDAVDLSDADGDDDLDVDVAAGPPTSRGPAPVVDVEPLGELGERVVIAGQPSYTGVFGQIEPDRYVVAPVALPPAEADGTAPLTGLPADPALADRPALFVKIDNTSRGRPQESLSQADLVYEEMIEGGFTRLGVVFHTNAAELGPIRSGRTTDVALLGSLNAPIFAWSGANDVHRFLLREQAMIDLGAQSRSEYFRADDRPGTYDLMVDGQALFDVAAEAGDGEAPLPHFEYRNDDVGLPASASPVSSVVVGFPSVDVDWTWDEAAGGWLRTQGGTPHVDAQGVQVLAANVIVAEVEQVASGAVDSVGATVWEEQFLGTGRGWVFTDGHAIEVTWTKPSIRSVATWTTPDGIPVALTPGTTWIELAPADATTFG